MPSRAFGRWHNDRTPRLAALDAQCAAAASLAPPDPLLADENLRGYVVLLSAHFQGFCRDLYLESAQVLADAVPVHLQVVVQRQCESGIQIRKANPNMDTLAIDFDRFGVDLRAALATDPANAPRRQDLAALNTWRNHVAHHGANKPAGPPLSLTVVRGWRSSLDGLAAALDTLMYTELHKVVRHPPW